MVDPRNPRETPAKYFFEKIILSQTRETPAKPPRNVFLKNTTVGFKNNVSCKGSGGGITTQSFFKETFPGGFAGLWHNHLFKETFRLQKVHTAIKDYVKAFAFFTFKKVCYPGF